MNKEFSKLCTPAKIYFAIAVIASIIMLFNGISFIAVFIKLIFAFVWTFVLGWLCKKGFTGVSWFLVLLPYIIILLAALKIYHATHQQKQIMRGLQLQGAYGQEAMTNNQQVMGMGMKQEGMGMGKKQEGMGMGMKKANKYEGMIK